MSTQSGIVTFDLRDPILRQGAEGVWQSPRQSPGPKRTASGLALTFDGRIDNAGDLRRRLGTLSDEAVDDRQIALAVFERWGMEGLRVIVGEWSAVIWDGPRRTLHLARDYMGARPLYYCFDARSVVWSSDLADVVTRTRRADSLSEQFAARFIGLRLSPEVTPYEDVHAVPPGVCVSISSSGRVTPHRFWTLDIGDIRYSDARAYEDHLVALWTDAVACRLRTAGTVWAELSGGLDSSSVVCMGDLLIGRGGVPAQSLRLVSHATLHSPEGDERRFIAEVERQVQVQSEIIGVEDHQDDSDPERGWVSPYALEGVGLETVRRVRAGGGRVVLSGRLGDAVMGCEPDNSPAVFDDLARGSVLTAFGNLRAWSRATRKPFVELALALFAREGNRREDPAIALLAPSLQAFLRDAPAIQVPSGMRRSKRALARMVLGYSCGARLDVPYRAPDIVYAYPFAHRPLVDFMLAIPGEQVSAPGMPRALMRRAFANIVPARILRRISKGYYPPAAFRAARRQAASMLPVRELEVVQRGWIDPDRLRTALRALIDGGGETGGDIHGVLRLEAWLQARRRRCAIPLQKEVNTNEVLHA